jgi:hypothetical protein
VVLISTDGRPHPSLRIHCQTGGGPRAESWCLEPDLAAEMIGTWWRKNVIEKVNAPSFASVRQAVFRVFTLLIVQCAR